MTLVNIKRPEHHLPHLHLSPDQSQAIDFIMEYPFNEVREKLIRKQALPEEKVDQAITEYRKFLVLARLGHGPLEMFSHYVDEVWHTHILFTRDYAKFCQMASVVSSTISHIQVMRKEQARMLLPSLFRCILTCLVYSPLCGKLLTLRTIVMDMAAVTATTR